MGGGITTGFALRHPMSERAWQASLVVELVDPVSGALVHRGVELRALLAGGGAAAGPAAVTLSGRFAFRGIAPEAAVTLLVTPRGAPFFPERVEVPPGGGTAAAAVRLARVVLAPHRGYPFAAGDGVIHGRLLDEGRPVVGVGVAVEEGAGILASPARTDADGEFVLHLRPNGSRRPNGGAARPVAAEPMPPGLEAAPARAEPSERRIGLVFTRGGERRRLPAEAGPVLPMRGRVGPADAIRWEALQPIEEMAPAAGAERPRRGPRA